MLRFFSLLCKVCLDSNSEAGPCCRTSSCAGRELLPVFSSGCSLSVPQGKQPRLEKAILVVVVGWCHPYSPGSEGLLLTKLTLRSIYGGILGLVAVPRLGLYN